MMWTMETGVSYAKLEPDHDERFLSLRLFGLSPRYEVRPHDSSFDTLSRSQAESFGTITVRCFAG